MTCKLCWLLKLGAERASILCCAVLCFDVCCVAADLCKEATAAHEKCYMSVINTGESSRLVFAT